MPFVEVQVPVYVPLWLYPWLRRSCRGRIVLGQRQRQPAGPVRKGGGLGIPPDRTPDQPRTLLLCSWVFHLEKDAGERFCGRTGVASRVRSGMLSPRGR
jgi:hypothetical protein